MVSGTASGWLGEFYGVFMGGATYVEWRVQYNVYTQHFLYVVNKDLLYTTE